MSGADLTPGADEGAETPAAGGDSIADVEAAASAPGASVEAALAGDAVATDGKTDEAPADASKTDEAAEPEAVTQLRSEVAARDAEIGEWRSVSREVLTQNRQLLDRVEFLQAQLDKAGVQIDPRDLRLLELEAKERAASQTQESQTKAQKAAEQKRINDGVAALRSEAATLAKANGFTERAVMLEWALAEQRANALRAGGEDAPDVTMADVVADMKARAQAKQAAANAKAPRINGKGSLAGAAPLGAPTTDNITRHLRSLGHDV